MCKHRFVSFSKNSCAQMESANVAAATDDEDDVENVDIVVRLGATFSGKFIGSYIFPVIPMAPEQCRCTKWNGIFDSVHPTFREHRHVLRRFVFGKLFFVLRIVHWIRISNIFIQIKLEIYKQTWATNRTKSMHSYQILHKFVFIPRERSATK